jgi:hypothetical protein
MRSKSIVSSLVVCSLAAVVIAALAASAQAAPAGDKPWLHKEVRLRLFSPAWRNIGEQTPDRAAKRFEVIYGHLAPAPFHQANPECKMIKYMLGPYTTKGEMAKLPPTAMAHDKDGKVVKAREWANWLVVPDSKEWVDYVVKMGARQFALGFDGIRPTSPCGGWRSQPSPEEPSSHGVKAAP